jgi:hypothetical protein
MLSLSRPLVPAVGLCARRPAWAITTSVPNVFPMHWHLARPYLGNAKVLRQDLKQVDSFADNIRYKSLMREGWIV